jgi:hypothetical protein
VLSRAVSSIAVLLVAGLVTQGCGGGDQEAASGASSSGKASQETAAVTTSPAKTAFIKKVDAICSAHEEQLNADVEKLYARRLSSQESRQREAVHVLAVTQILIPNLEGEVKELRALGEPSGGEVPMDVVIGAIEKMVDETKANPRRILDIAAPYETAEKTAEKYGITRCPVR